MHDRDLRELRTELRTRGYFRRPTARMVVELATNFVIAGFGLLVCLTAVDWLARSCGLLVWAAGSIGIGTNTHTSSHNATSNKRWVNELLTYLGYPVYFGLSATYWRHKHVVMHHSAPNVMGIDADADLSPWFATTADEIAHSSGMRRFYYERVQVLVFPIAIALTLFSQQIAGCVYVARCLRSETSKTDYVIDLGALLSHLILTLGIPMFFFTPGAVLAFYALRNIVIAYAMFSVFAPAHFLSEAVRLDKDLSPLDYSLAVTATTLNFRVGWLGRLMCSGLEYQIEHHLFPDISYVHYPAVSLCVRQFCKARGLPYRQYRWELALWRSLSAIRKPCGIARDTKTLFELIENKPVASSEALYRNS